MGDPLSITASVIAVLQASKAVCSYLYTIKNASTDSRKLLLDIQYVEGLLEIMKETTQNVQEAAKWESTVQVLNQAGNPLEVLQQVLGGLETKLKKEAEKQGVKKALSLMIYPFTKKETEEVVGIIERQKSLLLIALDNDHLLLSSEIKKQVSAIRDEVKQITAGVRDINVDLQPVRQNVEDENIRRSIQWLSKLTFQSTQDEIYRQKLPTSLRWFFALPDFQTWVSGGGKTLLCSGIAGAGKSVLAATVIQHLLDRYPQGDIGIAWIYCTFRARQQQTPGQMLASIAAQLVRQSEALKKVVSSMKKNMEAEPRSDQVQEIFVQCKNTFTSIYIVIDALDEYSEDSHGWVPFIEALKSANLGANLFVTARPLPNIEQGFADVLKVEIMAQEEDITAYISSELESPVLQKHILKDDELRNHIERQLLEKSQGMFLLTKLHMDALRQKAKYNKKALRKAVDQLPEKLDATYDNTFERIHSQEDDDAQLAIQVIAWIYHSFEDLKVRQLQQAIACQNGEDVYDDDSLIDGELLLSVCAGLVLINPETKAVRFMHTTVAEYLDRHFATSHPDTQFAVHHTCVKHIRNSGVLSKLMTVREFCGDSQWWWYELKEDREAHEAEIETEYAKCSFSRYAQTHVGRLDWPYKISLIGKDILHIADNLILHDCCRSADVTRDLPLAIFVADTPRVERLIKNPDSPHSPVALSRWLAYSILRGNTPIARLLFHAGADTSVDHTIRRDVLGTFTRGPDVWDCFFCALMTENEEMMDLMRSKKRTP